MNRGLRFLCAVAFLELGCGGGGEETFDAAVEPDLVKGSEASISVDLGGDVSPPLLDSSARDSTTPTDGKLPAKDTKPAPDGKQCQPGTFLCGGSCVDTQTSAVHCGGCYKTCNGTCVGGVCQCTGGLTSCSGQCVDLQTSSMNCGGCGTTCGGGMTCQAGKCQCPAGWMVCGGQCVDVGSSSSNCGTCGTTCSYGET